LPRLTLNHEPPDLCLLNRNHRCLAKIKWVFFFFRVKNILHPKLTMVNKHHEKKTEFLIDFLNKIRNSLKDYIQHTHRYIHTYCYQIWCFVVLLQEKHLLYVVQIQTETQCKEENDSEFLPCLFALCGLIHKIMIVKWQKSKKKKSKTMHRSKILST
jgi:hypothetical protein